VELDRRELALALGPRLAVVLAERLGTVCFQDRVGPGRLDALHAATRGVPRTLRPDGVTIDRVEAWAAEGRIWGTLGASGTRQLTLAMRLVYVLALAL
jgi:hypothetical protein